MRFEEFFVDFNEIADFFNKKVLPGLEPGLLDSESRVITITL